MREDAAGHKGVFLDSVGTRESAAKAIAIALRALGPHVLPWGELARPQLLMSHLYAATSSSRKFVAALLRF